jgi:hypothetical protein
MVPLSGVFNVPGVRDILAALPGVMKGPDGNIYLPEAMENVLTAIPIYSKVRNFALSDPKRVQQRFAGILSTIAGVSVRPSDVTATEQGFYYDELEPLLEMYKSMGVTFPTVDQMVAAGTYVREQGEAMATPDPSILWPGQETLGGTAA